jgi:HSP20 family protein
MIVRYWQPLREAEMLRRQINQVFDDLSHVAEPNQATWTPALDLVDHGDAFVLRAYLPGVDPAHVDVQVTREGVAISGQRPEPSRKDGERALYSDIPYGRFQRELNLPVAIRNDQVEAQFEAGVLTLTLPKVEEVRNKVVKINLGSATGNAAIAAADTNGTASESEPVNVTAQ